MHSHERRVLAGWNWSNTTLGVNTWAVHVFAVYCQIQIIYLVCTHGPVLFSFKPQTDHRGICNFSTLISSY